MKSFFIYFIVNLLLIPIYLGIQGINVWSAGMTGNDFKFQSLPLLIFSFLVASIPNLITYLILRFKFGLYLNLLFFTFFTLLLFYFIVIQSLTIL